MFFILFLGCAQPAHAMNLSDPRVQMYVYNKMFLKACAAGDLNFVKLCIGEGINVDIEVYNQMKPLHLACMFGHIDVVQLLLENGAEINAKMLDFDLMTPLHCAVFSGEASVMRYLLNAGADPDAQTELGFTAFGLALRYKEEAIIELFPNQSGE